MTWRIDSYLQTDPGCVRPLNEDSSVIVTPADAPALESRGVLAIVADGMGGHTAGEVASAMAVDAIRRHYYRDADGDAASALKRSVEAANAEVFDHASRRPDCAGMGTTSVALAICGTHASVASVGDSRLYLIRSGGIYRMTVDDSAVSDLVRHGVITQEAARHHEDRNVLLRALGTHDHVDIYTWQEPFPVRDGDCFVLCSDGLTDRVSDDEVLAQTMDTACHDAGRALVDLARARGGFDNITVIVLRLSPAPSVAAAVPITREVPTT